MFDRKTIHIYKSIRPPDEMKETILHRYAEQKKTNIYSRFRPITGIAACFLVVFMATVLYLGSNAPLAITSYGEKVSKAPIAVTLEDVPYNSNAQSFSMFRMGKVARNCVALDINSDKEMELSVSGGTLLLYNKELESVFYAGESLDTDSPTRVYWSIDGFSKTDSFTLRLVANGETTNLSLVYDKASESWMLAYAND